MTRLLGQHPAIEVETDDRGWRVEEAWWRRPLVRDYFKVVGPRVLALVYRDVLDGTWHLERLYD